MTSPDERLQQIEHELDRGRTITRLETLLLLDALRDARNSLATIPASPGYTPIMSCCRSACEHWAHTTADELRDARAEIERWHAAQAAHANAYERLTAELAAERAKVERVEAIAREAIDNIVSGHSTHWDSTMQYGAGCEQCKHERTVRDRLRAALAGEKSREASIRDSYRENLAKVNPHVAEQVPVGEENE